LTEGRPLAGVEHFSGAEQRGERREVPLQSEGSHDTAQLHGGVLALAPALPVEPAQVGGGDADLLAPLEQGIELPVHRHAGNVQARRNWHETHGCRGPSCIPSAVAHARTPRATSSRDTPAKPPAPPPASSPAGADRGWRPPDGRRLALKGRNLNSLTHQRQVGLSVSWCTKGSGPLTDEVGVRC